MRLGCDSDATRMRLEAPFPFDVSVNRAGLGASTA